MTNIVFIVEYVSDVSFGFFEQLHKTNYFSVLCLINQPLDTKSNRHLYYTDYILNFHKNLQKTIEIVKKADVVIYGNTSRRTIRKLNKTCKLIRISERKYKQALNPLHIPHEFISSFLNHYSIHRDTFLLAIGGYTYGDYLLTNAYRNRAYKFAYIGDIQPALNFNQFEKKQHNKTKKIIWIGSMDYDKKLDDLIDAICLLKFNKIYNFELKIVGDGIMADKYKIKCINNNLLDLVTFCGNLPINICEQELANANLYIATGGRQEGYNCTLLRAFNVGTICIANIGCGSTVDLLKSQKNFIYKTKDELYHILKREICFPNIESSISHIKERYEFLHANWSPNVAEKRFPIFIDCILNNKNTPFEDGVFSKATINRNYFKKYQTE